jgi:hypothetical protein
MQPVSCADAQRQIGTGTAPIRLEEQQGRPLLAWATMAMSVRPVVGQDVLGDAGGSPCLPLR